MVETTVKGDDILKESHDRKLKIVEADKKKKRGWGGSSDKALWCRLGSH